MEVQKYLLNHSLDQLKAEFGINYKLYENGLVRLNYDQIESPKTHPIVRECRGLTLCIHTKGVISRTFDRFYNFGEANTQNFDFSNADIFEKCDGSLVPVYWNVIDCRWEISTRGTCFAEASYGFDETKSFREMILMGMGFTEEEFQENMQQFGLDKFVTYVFEFIGPTNRIVTPYTEHIVVLLAAIGIDGKEYSGFFDIFKKMGMNVREPEIYSAKSAEDILQLCNKLPGLKEGFVCRDRITGERVKVKSSLYVKLHLLRGNNQPSIKNFIEVVIQNEQEEMLTYFPEFEEYILPIENALFSLFQEADKLYEQTKEIENQKEFALQVKDSKVGNILFKARKDKTEILPAFDSMSLKQRCDILKQYL